MGTSVLNPLFDIHRVRNAIEAGTLILTPNLRLARKMTDAWNLHCLSQGLGSWPAPNIQALGTWVEDCWLQLIDDAWPPALRGIAAQPIQEQWLWERMLAEDEAAGANPAGFTDLARRGWQLVREWQLPESELANGHHPGAKTLVRWGQAWERDMASHGLVNRLQRISLVCEAFATGALLPLPRICLAGFQSLAPLYETLIKTAGLQLEFLSPPASHQTPRAVSTANPEQEIIAAARWARDCARHNPAVRIGIVVPDLTAMRPQIERIFLQEFDPGWCWPDQAYRPLPFNISAAVPLADQPLVGAALALLALNGQRLPLSHLARVINSPFWGEHSREGALRASALEWILEHGQADMQPHWLRRAFSRVEALEATHQEVTFPSVRLTHFADCLRHAPQRCSFSEWREHFNEQLAILGWPGERPLDSLEYQTHEHWQTVLDKLVSLDKVSPPVSVTEALALLRKLVAQEAFQAETPDAQVQILGVLEAAGLQFDHLWVLQMDDRHWPAATSPHPLLPVDLQRRLQMPHASPARELALANELFNLFAGSAGNVVFSHARQDGDIDLQPSAFLASLESRPQIVEAPYHPWIARIADSARLDVVDDSRGPPLPTEVDAEALPRAGSFLTVQARCPFNAFASFRLGATPLPRPVLGLSPLARGNLIHYSLETLWHQLPDQKAWLQLDSNERLRLISTAIETAFATFNRRAPLASELSPRHLALEKQRISHLVTQWMLWEEAREPFSIEGLELRRSVCVDGLNIRLRIDRLDRLVNDHVVIIDYKTGNASLNGLTGDRLLSPQLALYALAVERPLAGLGYGLVTNKQKGVTFTGIASEGSLLNGARQLGDKGLPDSWENALETWYNQLKTLKEEIIEGQAPVIFYDRSTASAMAAFEPLNRWPGRDRLNRLVTDIQGEQP